MISSARFSLLMLIAVVPMLQSCSKPGDSTGGMETFIRFSIDETEYYFQNLTTIRSGEQDGGAGTVRIYPRDTPIILWIPSDVHPGAHEVALDGKPTGYGVSFSSEDMGFTGDIAHEGRIIIFHVSDEYVEGTFVAEVRASASKEAVILTDGRFRAYLN